MIKDNRINTNKARQAVIVIIVIIETLINSQDLTEIVNYNNNKSDSNLNNYKTNSNRDIIPILSKDIIDNIIETNIILLLFKIIQKVY